jgi:hypothetical protein
MRTLASERLNYIGEDMKMKAMINAALILASLTAGNFAGAADFNVRITNLTNGIWFTPFLVAAHPDGTSLFTAGQPASANLQAMAEGGDISGLVADMQGVGATIAENPAAGLLPPAMSADVDLNTDGTSNVLLSVVSMLLPTNDAFAGLNSITIPTDPGVYTFDLPAYDAGTEANDEMITGGGAPGAAGIPADPGDRVLRRLTPTPTSIYIEIPSEIPMLLAVPVTSIAVCTVGSTRSCASS